MRNHHATLAATLAAALAIPGVAMSQTGPDLPASAAKQNAPANSQAQTRQSLNDTAQNRQVQTGQSQIQRGQSQTDLAQNAQRSGQQGTDQQWNNQQRNAQGNQGNQGTQGSQGSNEELVNYLAAKLMLANECEVKMGEMAVNKAKSQEVKDLGKTLKQDHQQLNQKLTQAMPGLDSVQSLAMNTSGQNSNQNRNGNANQNNNRNQNANQSGNQSDDQSQARQANRPNYDQGNAQSGNDQFLDGAAQRLLDITRRAAEENHRAVTEALGEKQGDEFDRCFLDAQIGAHQWMLAELNAIQGTGPQQFTSIVDEAEQKVQDHLQKAKELAKKMEKESNSSGQ